MALEIPHGIDPQAVKRLQPVIQSLRSVVHGIDRRATYFPELEIRLRHVSNGIGKKAWERLLSAHEAFDAWNKVIDWSETCDFLYTLPDGRPARTTRFINDRGALGFVHCTKKRIAHCKINIGMCTDIVDHAVIALSTESNVEEVPEITTTTLVRIKCRKSFVWRDWRYDLTRVWEAPTYCQATAMRDKDEGTRYECEIELMSPRDYMTKHNDEHATLSTLQKIVTTLPDGCTLSA